MKNAVLVGSKGNLGPVWKETLEGMGYDVACLDPPEYDATVNFIASGKPIDVVLYNAAIDNPPGSGASFFGNRAEIINVNLLGCMNAIEMLIPEMKQNGGGVIINVGSIQGRIGADWRNYEEGFEKPVAYNCSKAALEQLTRSLAVQYGVRRG